MLERTRRDLALAARSLRRVPALSATVVLILGLAIGLSSAMFSVFRSVLLRRLPMEAPERVVELSGAASGAATEVPITPSQLRRLRLQTHSLRSAAGFAHWRVISDALADGDRRFVLRESIVTDDFFTVLGATPALGRLFHTGDQALWDARSSAAPVVLSYSAWKRAFGGDSSVIGRHLTLPKLSWTLTVVGVAPPGLDYPRGAEFWIAAEYGSLDVVGRLDAGASPEAARQDFLAFLQHDPDQLRYYAANAVGAQVHTIDTMVSGDARPALFALSAAVALLLLLACANVGNLMLLRATGRARELSIRRAIGASSSDLLRLLLAESVVLAVAGGALGVWLARMILDVLLRLAPSGLPRTDVIALAGTPVAIAVLVTAGTVLLFGVAPSFVVLRFDLASPLRSDTRGGTEGKRVRKVRHTLVASQIALAVIVLAGAGLLVRSLERLASLDLGYETEHLTMLSTAMPWRDFLAECRPAAATLSAADSVNWSMCNAERNFAAHDRVMEHLRETGHVVALSPAGAPPFLGSNVWMGSYAAEGQTDEQAKANPWFGFDAVGPDFFRALGVSLVSGRMFTDADRQGAPRVGIVTEGVARRLWPNQSAIGKRFRDVGVHSLDSLVTVVGVVRDFHYRLHRESTPTVFRPYRQWFAQGYFVIRTRGAELTEDEWSRAVDGAGTGATFVRAQTMDDLIEPQLLVPRFDAVLLTTFAIAALILAAVGLYGIIASAVSQQTREFGIRIALGATPSAVRNMVLREALIVAGTGTVVGLVCALAGSRLLTAMLFETRPSDPVTLALVAALLLTTAAAAAYVPARRATRIDPVRALRAE